MTPCNDRSAGPEDTNEDANADLAATAFFFHARMTIERPYYSAAHSDSGMIASMRSQTISLPRFLGFCLLLALPLSARAQGGPPLITNDPDTPGDGHWEINVAATGLYHDQAWEVSAPDVDVNYGLGERIQLSVHFEENWARATDGPWLSGLGPVELALRYRFVDEEKAGFALAVQPHWAKSWSSAAIRKGVAPEHAEFGVPIQVARHIGKAVAGAELGRDFISGAPDEWQLGAFGSRDCVVKGLQCLAEMVVVRPDHATSETLANLGARLELGEHFVVLGSIGRQLNGEHSALFYVGFQLLK